MKVIKKGSEPQKVMDYTTGSYFGELAIIENERRAATIIAKVFCKIIVE